MRRQRFVGVGRERIIFGVFAVVIRIRGSVPEFGVRNRAVTLFTRELRRGSTTRLCARNAHWLATLWSLITEEARQVCCCAAGISGLGHLIVPPEGSFGDRHVAAHG